MSVRSYDSFSPVIHHSAFIADSADVIGRVTIGKQASIWFNATIRGDINKIVIGDYSNVQDGVVIHLSDDHGTYIGKYVTIGHNAIVHAATIKDETLIGMGACILDGAVIGERCIIGANSLVPGGMVIPAGSLVFGSPAKVVKTLSLEKQQDIRKWADKYVVQSAKYLESHKHE